MDWIFLGRGRGREVYRHGNFVVKIPCSEVGANWNALEAGRYQHSEQGKWGVIFLAHCRLIPNSTILVMEYVEPTYEFGSLPRWCDFVDCYQVGYNRAGKLVAYDYGG